MVVNNTSALSSGDCRTSTAKCFMHVRKPSDVIHPEGWAVPADPVGAPFTKWSRVKRTSVER